MQVHPRASRRQCRKASNLLVLVVRPRAWRHRLCHVYTTPVQRALLRSSSFVEKVEANRKSASLASGVSLLSRPNQEEATDAAIGQEE